MDSNKDFIHIDELFRKMQDENALSYKSTDSAWDKMRAQLDKEMPTGGLAANGSSKRRYFYPLLALLLASSAGSFGYLYFKQPIETKVANVKNEMPAKLDILTQKQEGANTSEQVLVAKDNNSNAVTNMTALSATNVATNTVPVRLSKSNKQKAATIASKVNLADMSDVSKNVIPTTVNEIVQNRQLKDLDNTHDASFASNTNPSANIESKINQGPSNPQIDIASVSQDTYQPNSLASATTPVVIKTGIDEKEVIATNVVTNNNGDIYIKAADGNWYQKVEKTAQIQHFKASVNNEKLATGPLETKAINELVLIDNPSALSLEVSEDKTIAANETDNASNDLLLNSKKSTKLNNSFFNAIHKKADDFALLFINSPTFSAVMNFGVNYTAIGRGSLGYQFGLGTMYYLNENLSLGLELKYVNNQFFNYTYYDNSQTYNLEKNGNTYNGTEKIENNTYTFSAINRLQIPIYLNYYFTDKMALIGGLQINYAAPIKYNVENEIKINDQYATIQLPQQSPLEIDASNDFKSNLGMGYVIGLGVDISKSWNIDLRVSQNIFQNATSNNQFIHSLYRNPNIQLNMVFNIGKKKKEMMLMDTRK